jgi:hypothetical protein
MPLKFRELPFGEDVRVWLQERVNALSTQRFCRNDHPNDALLWDCLPMELRRQRLTITDTVSNVPNTQEGVRKNLPVIVFLCPELDSVPLIYISIHSFPFLLLSLLLLLSFFH